ncbi:hypothetical protein FRB90_000909 [Tulasnella sp. 427]|nr:hypothetical protein FRB90_000909 [Tulasnella sp. 427]
MLPKDTGFGRRSSQYAASRAYGGGRWIIEAEKAEMPSFLQQIHTNTTIPYTSLPAVPTQTVLLQDTRYTFTYLGVTAIGNSPYRLFSLWDGWMERSWSVYALDGGEDVIKSAAAGGLKRAGSLSASSASSSGAGEPTGKWYSGAGIVGSSERRAIKNAEVRNALTIAFLQTIARSLPSTEIII